MISTSAVTIKELKFDGSKLTKAKVLSIALIEHIPALKRLMEGSLIFLAKYPIQTYCKAVESVGKITGTQPELPPKEEIVGHFSDQNSLCGAILYDPQKKKLLNTWFTDTDYVTPKMKELQNESNCLTSAYTTVANQEGEPEINHLIRALRPLANFVSDTRLYHYIEICQATDIDESFRWENQVEMTTEQSQQWYDDGEIIGIKSNQNCDGDTYIRRVEHWQEIPIDSLNAEWVSQTLNAPSQILMNWAVTKQWLMEHISEEFDEIEARIDKEDLIYESVKQAFSNAPFIEIF
ncbi:hypothetical protein [Vibrio penaeicida]|uniref:Uncharacterized protein n=1 Tax=Vibrio penaeicida TaxID=104609 RepID=A0AAV5NK65_9VIBR|nr:hypothetical protein [Vibrio penaeicida]RTZ24085.1 hypothetical protein EKN09_05620 [Vibrio penaeicida]GLQ70965.1 hypothetical protein GCM10007932_03250 [Vibrio penaeicida]